jgi:hypothetical protein
MIALFATLAGCSVEPVAPETSDSVANRCDGPGACGSSGVCSAGVCYAKESAISNAIVEIVPDSTAAYGAGVSFLVEEQSVAAGGAARDIQLPALTELVGRVQAITTAKAPCTYATAPDGSIPARIELTRTDADLGIPRATYVVNTTRDTPRGTNSAPGGWAFSVFVSPGVYDVYMQPLDDTACPISPVLLSGQRIEPGDGALPIALSEPVALTGTMIPPGQMSLEGWTVDLIEPQQGRTISTTAVLGSSSPTNFAIFYRPIVGASPRSDAAGSPLIRLVPPKGTVGPTTIWDLAAADLANHGKVSLDMSALSVQPLDVAGQLRAGDAAVVTGNVTFSSVSLSGAGNGITASYTVTVPTSEDGSFKAKVLPGDYRVIASPDPALPWAITETRWTVGEAQQPNPTVVVGPKAPMTGQADVATFGPLSGATVTATASAAAHSSAVLDAALGKTRARARSRAVRPLRAPRRVVELPLVCAAADRGGE